jgi:hypothetical protein
MKCTIVDKEQYIRADLLERQSAEETAAFLKAIGEERRKHQRKRVLICVHAPRAFFHVEKYQASRFLETLAGLDDVRVALVSRHFEVRLLHEYLEVLARLKHAGLRAFGDEATAMRWLLAREAPTTEASTQAPSAKRPIGS